MFSYLFNYITLHKPSITRFQSHCPEHTSRSQYHSRNSVKDDNGSNDSFASSSAFSNKISGNFNNSAAGTASVLIAAANAAAVKVRQRKTGRKTGVLYNCHVYPSARSTNCDISEESNNYKDTRNDATDGEITRNESEPQDTYPRRDTSARSSCSNNSPSSLEDDHFDMNHRPPSPFQHSGGIDQLTNRQIDKVINLFRPRNAIITSDYASSSYHHPPSGTIAEHKRRSTSAKVKCKKRVNKMKVQDMGNKIATNSIKTILISFAWLS